MFHLLAYYTNDLASAASNTALGRVSDPIFSSFNSGYQMPFDGRLNAMYYGNVGVSDVRLNSPIFRNRYLPHPSPVSATALPADNAPVIFFGGGGYPLMESEEIAVEGSRGVVAAADAYALLWISRNPIQPINPLSFTIRATSTVTVAEGAWSSGALTLSETLPAGNYDVVGMRVVGTALLAGRLIIPGQDLRPGVLADQAEGEFQLPYMRNGAFGKFGTLPSFQNVQMDYFGTGANTAQTVYLDLVKK